MPMPRSNLAAFAANVGSAYEKLTDKTTSTAGAVASGIGDAIKAGADGYIAGTQLENMEIDNALKANELEVSNATKGNTINAQNAQNAYAQAAANTGIMVQGHLQTHIPQIDKAPVSNPTPIQSAPTTQNPITPNHVPYANYTLPSQRQ